MSLLNSLFPEMYSNSSNGGTNLSSGGTPEAIQGNDRSALSNYASIPANPTQKDVETIAKQAGEIEASTVLLKEWSNQALSAQNAALANLDVRINHSQSSMKNEEQYRKKISKHGKAVLEHKIINSATKANLDGYQQTLNNASDTIHI